MSLSEIWEQYGLAILVGLLQCFGIASLSLVGVWMGKYGKGFAWDGSTKQFNWHPLCMVLSMVFLSSEAMIIYRVLRQQSKTVVKIIHMIIQVLAFIVAVIGLQAAFDFHNHNNIPNMYSLHSWLGIVVILLFSFQLVCGFVSFLFPKLPDAPRASYLKLHVFFGTAIFVLAIATCLTGITEKALFSIGKTYKDLPPEGIVINMLGVVLVVAGGLAFFIVANPNYGRSAGAEEHGVKSTDRYNETFDAK